MDSDSSARDKSNNNDGNNIHSENDKFFFRAAVVHRPRRFCALTPLRSRKHSPTSSQNWPTCW